MSRKESTFEIDGIFYKIKYESPEIRIMKNNDEVIILPEDLVFYINQDLEYNANIKLHKRVDNILNEDDMRTVS